MIHQPNKKEGVFYGQQHSCGSMRSVKCCDSDRNDIRRRKVDKRINKLTVFSHKRMLINNLVKDKKEDMYMKKSFSSSPPLSYSARSAIKFQEDIKILKRNGENRFIRLNGSADHNLRKKNKQNNCTQLKHKLEYGRVKLLRKKAK